MSDLNDTQPGLKIALTISEAASAAGISRSHIYKLLSTGTLTRRKIGKRTVILREELESFILALPTQKWRNGRAK
ncbi:MAG: helix-turn-helix domain-containing protein [Pseudomonadota bacterium]|nr:helix-turn-helix domain-containing protein [Pseudomonadota bacterium]